MKLTRRSFVKTGTAATVLFGAGYTVQGRDRAALVVFDSRIPQSVAFAEGIAAERLDMAGESARRWRRLRGTLPDGPVVGLTRWSDLVLVRGFAEGQRKRLRRERRLGDLFAWELS